MKSKVITSALLSPDLNEFQIWALQHPEAGKSKAMLPMITLVEGLVANEPTYLAAKRQQFGKNFCCAGQVVLGDFETIEVALTSPQARTWRLGTSVLEAAHLPNQDTGDRNVFLLSLSDKAAGGNGDHEAFNSCMQHYLLGEETLARQQDDIAQGLLSQLASDYQQMPHGSGDSFFTDEKRGLLQFMIRYLHYVMFGLDPNDQATMALLMDLHYTRKSPTHYFAAVGDFLQSRELNGHGNLPALIEQVATVYEQAPALANFQENQPEYNQMTRRELAKLTTSIMAIAALQGPLHIIYTAMGFRPLPAYLDQPTADIHPPDHWDKLDLDDRAAVKCFILECGRLWAPVSASHRVATEPFTVTIGEQEQTFPAGTKVLIPMSLGLLDEDFWGASTYEFDAQRENLCPYHMGFHSVGDRHAGRICPGKEIALNMMIDILVTVGRVRRTL